MTLVTAHLVFAEDTWRERHGFVTAAGGIVDTGTPNELAARHPEQEREDWGDVAVLPGTVNAHDHSFQSLLRGLGDDLSFAAWRDRVLYPMAERLDRRAIIAGARLDFGELAKAGVTTVVDFFYLHDGGNENALAVAEAAREVGIRLVIARAMYDWTGAPKRFQETPLESERRFRDLLDAVRGDTRVFAQPAPHSIHAASPDMIAAGVALSEELSLPLHVHVAEGRYERDQSLEQRGRTPVAFLDDLGALTPRTLMVHCVWVDDADLSIMSERGCRVVTNPSANAFLGDGVAPVARMLTRDIPVCLGTDGGCTNNRRSVFEEMRMVVLLARAAAAEGDVLRADDALLMGTARGGQCLDLPIGRIAPGYAADLVVVDLDALSIQQRTTATQPVGYVMQYK